MRNYVPYSFWLWFWARHLDITEWLWQHSTLYRRWRWRRQLAVEDAEW